MSPRRRRIDDQEIASRARMLLLERGPAAVTFAEVAKRCGLAPPTLVQRFGQKEKLVAAVLAGLRALVVERFADVARQHRPIAALRHALHSLADQHVAVARSAPTPEMAAYSLEIRLQISYSLTAAVELGELPRCDVAALARALQVAFYGAVGAAQIEGKPVAEEVAAAIDVQLAIYL